MVRDHPIAKHYYECHITIEPLEPAITALLKTAVAYYGFRIADLYMTKRKEDTPERSKYDTFMTGRNKDYKVLEHSMFHLINHLKTIGIKVWRYKIEDTLIDSKIDDELGLING